MSIAALARPEIRNLRAYKIPNACGPAIKLNANESPLATGTTNSEGLNRYPARPPAALTQMMANHYDVATENLLVTRGSSEGIDLLIRSFCSAGQDNVLICPPAFEMYRVFASIQGVQCVDVPLRAAQEYALDTDSLLNACDIRSKLIFICSPNNPSGGSVPRNDVLRILEARKSKSLVILDEAYIEFSDMESLASLVSEYDNLVVLRTLSKARALAGARCGAVIASNAVIDLVDRVLAPYALSTPVIKKAEQALSKNQLARSDLAIREIIDERKRLYRELATCDSVVQIYPSQANFLLVRFQSLVELQRCLDEVGIAIRLFGDDPLLVNCARITVSLKHENDKLIKAIRSLD